MHHFSATVCAALLLATPFVASANTFFDTADQAPFLLSRQAAINVNFDTSRPSCVATTSVSTVDAGQAFQLAWGSSGTVASTDPQNMWAPNGLITIVINEPGTHTYPFVFYGIGGSQTSCEAQVIVK